MADHLGESDEPAPAAAVGATPGRGVAARPGCLGSLSRLAHLPHLLFLDSAAVLPH